MFAVPYSLIAWFLVAAVGRHLLFRMMVNSLSPAVALNMRRSKQATARFEAEYPELNRDEADPHLRSAKHSQIFEEEKVSFRPALIYMAASLLLLAAVLAGSYLFFRSVGGPLSDSVWWVWPVWIAILAAWQTATKGSDLLKTKVSLFVIAVVVVPLVLAPFTLFYMFAPVGVVLFTITSYLVGHLLWRLVPHRGSEDFPAVAMLFM